MKCVGELLVIDLKGYNDGVNEFERSSGVRSREKTVGKHHLINGVSRDKNAYLSKSRIVNS